MKIRCKTCNCEVEVPVTEQQVKEWYHKGTLIQNEFPELSSAEREMLITGICENCWNEMFPPIEEDEIEFEYFVSYNKKWKIMTKDELKLLIETAKIDGEEIKEFSVITLDFSLQENQARYIGYTTNLEYEIEEEMSRGESPFVSVMCWLK